MDGAMQKTIKNKVSFGDRQKKPTKGFRTEMGGGWN
jgi:hypothetical protein